MKSHEKQFSLILHVHQSAQVELSTLDVRYKEGRNKDSWVQWTKQEVVSAACDSRFRFPDPRQALLSVSALSLGMRRTSSSCDHDLLLSSPSLDQGTSESQWVGSRK